MHRAISGIMAMMGTCIQKFEGKVMIQFENCTNVDLPEEFVLPCRKWLRPKPLWTLQNKTRIEKQWLLEGSGIVRPTIDGLLEANALLLVRAVPIT